MIRSTRPRTRAGISSSIAELIAAYSPPMPAPVKKRATKKYRARAGERGRDRRDEVQHQRDQEQLLAPEAVGELAEEQRADAGAGDVDRRRRCTTWLVGEREAAALLGQPRGDRADDRHLEPVEDPDRPEADDHQPVEARPRQPVQPRRDAASRSCCSSVPRSWRGVTRLRRDVNSADGDAGVLDARAVVGEVRGHDLDAVAARACGGRGRSALRVPARKLLLAVLTVSPRELKRTVTRAALGQAEAHARPVADSRATRTRLSCGRSCPRPRASPAPAGRSANGCSLSGGGGGGGAGAARVHRARHRRPVCTGRRTSYVPAAAKV